MFVFNSAQVLQARHLSCFKCHWYNDRKCPILAIIGLGSNRNNTLLLTSQILEFHFTWVVFPLFCFPWTLACFHSTMHHTSCLLVERSLTRGFISCFSLSTSEFTTLMKSMCSHCAPCDSVTLQTTFKQSPCARVLA